MNELIKKLAIQVQRTEMPGVLYVHPEFVEKFAEMLIKECADAADMAVEADCDDIGLYIVEHFGVK